MSESDGPEQKYALVLIGLLVTAVVAAMLGLGVWKARAVPAGAPAAAQTASVASVEHVLFEVGQDRLPVTALEVLQRVSNAARNNPATMVTVSAFHDASGNPEAGADLARRRAQQVQHALEANGVQPAQIALRQPEPTVPGGQATQAQRVEVRLE